MGLEHVPGGGPGPGVRVVQLRGGRRSHRRAPPTTSTRPSRSRTAVWPERGVPIEPVAIQVPGRPRERRARLGRRSAGCRVSERRRPADWGLEKRSAAGCRTSAPATHEDAPPSAMTRDDHRRGERGSGHRSAAPPAEHGPLAGSMDLVQDGIDDPIRQDLHPVGEVGGEECFGIARLRHASCSWSRMGVRASASRAARIAAVA